MDHSSIRGLGTAFHLFLAGCLGLKSGIIALDAHAELSRVPLIVPAHRVASSVAALSVVVVAQW
jgi:hypothetical protein